MTKKIEKVETREDLVEAPEDQYVSPQIADAMKGKRVTFDMTLSETPIEAPSTTDGE